MTIVLYKEWLCTTCGMTWPHSKHSKSKPRRCDRCGEKATRPKPKE